MVQILRPDPDRLYNLLPAMYRIADSAQGYGLRALLRLIAAQSELLRADIQQLWDNDFIETCDQWAIPYIGDLVANRTLHDIDAGQEAATAEGLFTDLAGPNLRPISTIRTRADVAKTIYYRRRKGTTAMLQELAGDVTGWGAHVVEFFETLTWTQNLNHLRLGSTGCADLRRVSACARVDGPFDAASHVVDVRAIAQAEGWYNVPNLGFFLWRLEAFPLPQVRARAIGGSSWRFTFSPLGNSAPLFSRQDRLVRTPGMSPELFVSEPIPPSSFFDDLAAWKALPAPRPDHSIYYGDVSADPDWSITVYEQSAPGSALVPVALADISCVNLGPWQTLAQPAHGIGIDVGRGRLAIGSDRPASSAIYVSFNQGFSAHMGGGPYLDLEKWVVPDASAGRIIKVNATMTLDQALTAWAAATDQKTIIRISDNDTHTLSAPLTLNASSWLVIQAQPGYRPHIRPRNGLIEVKGSTHGSSLTLTGLLIEGGIDVSQDIRRLRILHSTLVPGRSIEEEPAAPPSGPSLVIDPGTPVHPSNTALDVEIAFSITGPLQVPETIDGLWVLDSIVDGRSGTFAIANQAGTNGPMATIERSTILGPSFFRKIETCSDTIFSGTVSVQERVDGCLRFSFIPNGSLTPQQYRCQPSFEISTEIDAARRAAQASGTLISPGWDGKLAASIKKWLVPSFESILYGLPEYAQLRLTAPQQVRTGASDGGEMGAFNHLKQVQRETNLRIRLGEYVPFGRAAGIIYVT